MAVPAVQVLVIQFALLAQVAARRVVSHLQAVIPQSVVAPAGSRAHQAVQGVVVKHLRLGRASQVVLQAEQVAAQVIAVAQVLQAVAVGGRPAQQLLQAASLLLPGVIAVLAEHGRIPQAALHQASGGVVGAGRHVSIIPRYRGQLQALVVAVADQLAQLPVVPTRVLPPGQSVRRVVSPGAGKGTIAAHLAQLAHQAAAGVVAPTDAAAGVAHAGALPNPVYPLVVTVADRGGVGNDGGAIPPAGVAVALSQQAVEAVIAQAGQAAARIGLFHQVAQGVIGVAPGAHIGVLQGRFASAQVVLQAGQGYTALGLQQASQRVILEDQLRVQGLAVFLGRDHPQDLAPGVQPGCAGAVQGVQRLHLAQPAGCQGQSIIRLGAAAVGGRALDQASQGVVCEKVGRRAADRRACARSLPTPYLRHAALELRLPGHQHPAVPGPQETQHHYGLRPRLRCHGGSRLLRRHAPGGRTAAVGTRAVLCGNRGWGAFPLAGYHPAPDPAGTELRAAVGDYAADPGVAEWISRGKAGRMDPAANLNFIRSLKLFSC